MIPARLRRAISLLLLLGFLGIFTHEILPGHAHEKGHDRCQVCENWLQQAAVESAPLALPKPQEFELPIQIQSQLPVVFFNVSLRLRGPPASLTVL